MDHAELLAATARGDRRAFAALYDAFKSGVYNTALGYLHDADEAEEVTQDVFVQIFQSAGEFVGQSQVRTWVYRITVNAALDRLRYHNRKKRFATIVSLFKPGSVELEHDQPDFEHPGVALERREEAAFLFQAIDTLPEKQKTAFVLSQVEQLPQQEIADVMNLSVKAVESLIQRAKASLRAELATVYDRRRISKQ